ncbi:MAG: hypothetical protein AAGD22_11305 [Verrucomicrobiota bacterium]
MDVRPPAIFDVIIGGTYFLFHYSGIIVSILILVVVLLEMKISVWRRYRLFFTAVVVLTVNTIVLIGVTVVSVGALVYVPLFFERQ